MPTSRYQDAQQNRQVSMATTQQQSSLNVRVIRGLGITQIVIGVLTIIFGIIPVAVNSYFWVNQLSFGIWFGIWITISGVIGVNSSSKPQNNILNGMNMGFNITSSVVSLINGSFAGFAVGYYSLCREIKVVWFYVPAEYESYYRYTYNELYYSVQYGDITCNGKSVVNSIYACLIVLMIAEFLISLFISMFCYKGGGCGCFRSVIGQIIHSRQPVGYAAHPTTNLGATSTTTNSGYPGTAIPPKCDATVRYQPYPTRGYPTQGQQPVKQPDAKL